MLIDNDKLKITNLDHFKNASFGESECDLSWVIFFILITLFLEERRWNEKENIIGDLQIMTDFDMKTNYSVLQRKFRLLS